MGGRNLGFVFVLIFECKQQGLGFIEGKTWKCFLIWVLNVNREEFGVVEGKGYTCFW